LAVGAASLWCLTAASRLGATYDEPLYVRLGLERWRSGSYWALIREGTMPLPTDLQTWPLHVAELVRGRPFDPAGDLETLLPAARAVTLLFWGVLLHYGWGAAGSRGGPGAARLALALLAPEPTLLAHAALATTDVAVAACLVA